MLAACTPDTPSDLAQYIPGTYTGSVSLHLDTDSAQEVAQQRVEVFRIDDTRVGIRALVYPTPRPLDSLELQAGLTATPYGFIQSKGVMLTFEPVSIGGGTVRGVPFSVSGGQQIEHGKYDQESGELIFALEIESSGVLTYEMFVGKKE
ncbi:MAG: hypothetical protein OHK0039_12330 [Bacteroidia bacterium]